MMWNDLDEKRVGEKCGIFGMWLKIIPKVNWENWIGIAWICCWLFGNEWDIYGHTKKCGIVGKRNCRNEKNYSKRGVNFWQYVDFGLVEGEARDKKSGELISSYLFQYRVIPSRRRMLWGRTWHGWGIRRAPGHRYLCRRRQRGERGEKTPEVFEAKWAFQRQ